MHVVCLHLATILYVSNDNSARRYANEKLLSNYENEEQKDLDDVDRHVDVDPNARKPSDEHSQLDPAKEDAPGCQVSGYRDVHVHDQQVAQGARDDEELEQVFAGPRVTPPAEDGLKQFPKSNRNGSQKCHDIEAVVTPPGCIVGAVVQDRLEVGGVVNPAKILK